MNPIRRMNRHRFNRMALPTLQLAAAGLPGWAQGDPAANLPRVNVGAPGIGAHTVCPAFEAAMRKALAQVAMQQRELGLLDVNFAIDGRRIDDVAVVGGPFNYRSATRRAVHSLDCDNGSAGPQAVRLQVVFKDL